MPYHPVVNQIVELLTADGCWFETFEHEPVKTSEEAAQIRDGYTLHQGAKALIVRIKTKANEKFFAMFVIPGDLRFNGAQAKSLLQAKDIRFASVEEVADITQGIVPGGVPPFGHLFKLRLVVDQRVLANEKIIFNAGDRAFSIAMKAADYQRIVQPEVLDLVGETA